LHRAAASPPAASSSPPLPLASPRWRRLPPPKVAGRDFAVDACVADAPSSSAPGVLGGYATVVQASGRMRWRRLVRCCRTRRRTLVRLLAAMVRSRLDLGPEGLGGLRLSVRRAAPLLRGGAALLLRERAGLLCGRRALQHLVWPPFPDALRWLRGQRASVLGMPLSCNTWMPGWRPRAWTAGFFSASGMW
jgi:hypothetical protein